MKKTLIVGAALALAVIGLPAAFAAPGADTQIAIERAAPAPLDLAGASVEPCVRNDAVDGKSVIGKALAAAPVPSSPPRAVSAGAVICDRLAVAYHLLL